MAGAVATAFISSTAAGIGAYAVNESMNGREINESEMIRQGFNVGIKGLVAFGAGMSLASAGAYSNLLIGGKFSFATTIARSGVSMILQFIWKLGIK